MPDLTAQIMAGIFLGLVYRKTGSLFPGIVAHYRLDFGAATLAWFI